MLYFVVIEKNLKMIIVLLEVLKIFDIFGSGVLGIILFWDGTKPQNLVKVLVEVCVFII